MAKQYDNTNRGMLFRVRDKKTENHPDLNGKINFQGTEHWASGWWQKYVDKETGEERTGISISVGDEVRSKSEVKRVETQSGAAERPAERPKRAANAGSTNKFDDMEDDIPF